MYLGLHRVGFASTTSYDALRALLPPHQTLHGAGAGLRVLGQDTPHTISPLLSPVLMAPTKEGGVISVALFRGEGFQANRLHVSSVPTKASFRSRPPQLLAKMWAGAGITCHPYSGDRNPESGLQTDAFEGTIWSLVTDV